MRKDLDEATAKVNGAQNRNSQDCDIKQEGGGGHGVTSGNCSGSAACANVKEEQIGGGGDGNGNQVKEESSSGGSVGVAGGSLIKTESEDNDEEVDVKDGIKKEGGSTVGGNVKQEKNAVGNSVTGGNAIGDKKDGNQQGTGGTGSSIVKSEKELKEAQRIKEMKIIDSDMVRDLKAQLK